MTAIDLCNDALCDIRHDRTITAFTDTSRESVQCARLWPRARREVLSAHPWQCLTRSSAPVPVTLDGPDGFPLAYALPEDRLRIVYVTGSDGSPVSWRVENGALFTDSEALRVAWTEDDEDPDNWPEHLLRAVTAAMSVRLARVLSGSDELVTEAARNYSEALAAARKADNLSTAHRPGTENPYLDARK